MPVQKYEIELSDGRKFVVETEGGPPSEQDVLASLSSQSAPAAEAEVAPGQHPMAAYGEGAVKGLGKGLLGMVDPRTYIDTAKMLYEGATSPSTAGPALLQGVARLGRAAIGLEGPEAMGEAHGGLLPGAIPVGGMLGKAGKYARESRASNVITALGEGNSAKKQVIEKLVNSGELELPVSASAKSLQAKLGKVQDAAEVELKTAKGGLSGLPEVSTDPIIKSLESQRPAVQGAAKTTVTQPRTAAGFTSKKAEPVVTTTAVEGSGNQALLTAVDKQIDELVKLSGSGKAMTPEALQKFKEQAQKAATKAYSVASGTGAEAAAGAEAAEIAAKAVRETLESSPGIPEAVRNRLTAANKAEHAILAATQPLEARRVANIGKPFISRSIAGLLGRGLTGGGTSALGAAGGVEAGALFQQVLFNTMSAATKKAVAPFLESGDIQRAVQIAYQARLAENAAKRSQQETPK